MQPEAIVARVWPGSAAQIEPLGGGITNHNFKIAIDGGAFVLRIGGQDTELLGIDRDAEHSASVAAARLGIGPEVVEFVQPEGYLVTAFIAGRPVPPEEMREAEKLGRVAALLRAVHAGEPFPATFDSFRVVETYADTARERGGEVPGAYAEAKRFADAIERTRPDEPSCPCHNDLLNANFIDDGDRLRLVDWEYAGMGDRFFDLANFAVNHELEPDDERTLLEAYFGEARDADVCGLTLMRFMSDFREAMWSVVQQAISTLDFDFRTYTEQHFDRLGRTAAEPRFQAALESSQS
ncbi:MAG: choline kinase family protein [Actinomycetota bacterium]|nr:choline kinase family protein [Actinomycetota bacterium]